MARGSAPTQELRTLGKEGSWDLVPMRSVTSWRAGLYIHVPIEFSEDWNGT